MADDESKILVFPGAASPGQASYANQPVVELLEGFLALAKRGILISVGIAAVTKNGDALENFAMAHMHSLGFLGSIDLLKGLVQQRILDVMTTEKSERDLVNNLYPEEAPKDGGPRPGPDDDPFPA